MHTIIHPHNYMRLETHEKLKNHHVHVHKPINRSERGSYGLCTRITCIICMRMYFVYSFKLEKTQSAFLKLLSSTITAKSKPQTIPDSLISLLSHSSSILNQFLIRHLQSSPTLLPLIVSHLRSSTTRDSPSLSLQFFIAKPNLILSQYPHPTLSPSLL